jgi:predicted dienelactone hydrolase
MQSAGFTARWMATLVALLVVGPMRLGLSQETVYNAKPGKYAVETISYDWQDKTRDRDVPVKLYFPKSGAGPFPVIIFSHGLGGSRDGYEYLGRHWASHG